MNEVEKLVLEQKPYMSKNNPEANYFLLASFVHIITVLGKLSREPLLYSRP